MASHCPAGPDDPALRPVAPTLTPAQAHGKPDATSVARALAPGPRAARILVAEDNAFVREGVVKLINSQPDLFCCGETDSISSISALIAEHKPDVLLLDLRLRDGDALGLIGSLRSLFADVAVLVLTQFDEMIYAEKALRAGALGYLMKEAAAEDLLLALRTVLRGKIYMSSALSARWRENPGKRPAPG